MKSSFSPLKDTDSRTLNSNEEGKKDKLQNGRRYLLSQIFAKSGKGLVSMIYKEF